MRSVVCSLMLVFVSVAAPGTARAILSIDAPATYRPGDVLEIEIRGDSEGRRSLFASTRLTFDSALQVLGSTTGPLPTSDLPQVWLRTGADGLCGDDRLGLDANQCVALDAFAYDLPTPIDLLPATLSTWQFDTSDATGDLTFIVEPWGNTAGVDPGFFFDFPGTQITVAMIPEPSTALLLGLGLAALASRRVRSRC